MPERVKIVFSDTESDLVDRKSLVRNTAEAFEDGRQPRTSSILDKYRNGRQSKAKTITFPDEGQPVESKSNESPTNHDKGVQNGSGQFKGRLKQRASDLLKVRQQLPIWSHADEIRNKVAKNDVLLLIGETGSGKSTQIPQFLLPLCQTRTLKDGSKVGGCIAITQPRRVAATSLARRVAEEMGTPLGNSSPASQVGYSVRFDTSTSPSTKVKFLTDGMLLQELVRDPWLREYSVVVVDEVHERGVNVDLVIGFLQRLIVGRDKNDGRGGVPLKVVVMSATADMEKIQNFFERDNAIQQPNGDSEIHTNDQQEDETTWNGFSDEEKKEVPQNKSSSISTKVTSCSIKGRQYPVTPHYTPVPLSNTLDAALDRITTIHAQTPLPGDILVFLPGQEMIDTLESMCISYAHDLITKSKEKGAPKLPKLLVLPLFAALPTSAQQRVFESTPPFTRKIILSTNIAETSVTVPGIRHVIDTGKRKARFFRPGLNLDTLLTKSISRSSANQRAGRAGREAPGNCYRLYTQKTFYELNADTEPEILRCDLSQLVLTLKAHKIDNIPNFPLLTPPPQKALERALLHLLRLEALDQNTGEITKKGRRMSALPIPANLASILLSSMEPQYDCLNEIIDIVSALSVENIWLPIHNNSSPVVRKTTRTEENPENENENEEDDDDENNPIIKARTTLYRREGDHLTLLSAVQSYEAEQTNRKEWCKRHAISHRAMNSAFEVRKQLRKLMLQKSLSLKNNTNINTVKDKKDKKEEEEEEEKEGNHDQDLPTRILRVLLTGLSENTAYLATNIDASTTTASSSSTSTSSQRRDSSVWIGPYSTFASSGRTTGTNRNLSIHPSSVLFARSRENRPGFIMFSEFVVTGRAYARCVSAVERRWIDELQT